MKQLNILMMTSCLVLASGTLRADILAYDNLGDTAHFPFIASDAGQRVPSVDDLGVLAGGALTQVSFAIIADSLGGAVDAQIILAEDNGDGVPDFVGPGATDALLLDKTVTGVNGPFGFIPTGNALVVDVDVSADGVNLTAGSTVWAMLSLTRFGFAADVNPVYGPIGVGSSDGLVYQQNRNGSISSVVPPDNDTSDGLGWQLHVVPEPTAALLITLIGGIAILKRNRRRIAQ